MTSTPFIGYMQVESLSAQVLTHTHIYITPEKITNIKVIYYINDSQYSEMS